MAGAATPNASELPVTEADLALIKRIIPHRYPFLFIDKVVDIVPHKAATGIKNVTCNEPFFEGHFPSRPIMPGVIIIEAMAQTSAVLVGISLEVADQSMMTYFMAIDNCRFRRMVVPGDVLRLEVEIKRGGGRVWKMACRGMVGDELACEADLTAMMDRTGHAGRQG